MIAALRGKIFALAPGKASIDTGCGIIAQVLMPVSSFPLLREGQEALLHTVFKIKDEDVQLFGFLQPQEKALFERLLSVSGVGGRIALSCLSTFSAGELVSLINAGDVSRIQTVHGIGKKTAQRIILELTGKLELEREGEPLRSALFEDLVSGLVNLGYPAKAARDAVQRALQEDPSERSFEQLFKALLKRLNR